MPVRHVVLEVACSTLPKCREQHTSTKFGEGKKWKRKGWPPAPRAHRSTVSGSPREPHPFPSRVCSLGASSFWFNKLLSVKLFGALSRFLSWGGARTTLLVTIRRSSELQTIVKKIGICKSMSVTDRQTDRSIDQTSLATIECHCRANWWMWSRCWSWKTTNLQPSW